MGVTCSISFHGAWHRHISYGGCFSRDAPVPRAAAYHGLRATEHRANGWGYYMHPPVWCPFHSTQGWCPRDNARYIKSYYGTHSLGFLDSLIVLPETTRTHDLLDTVPEHLDTLHALHGLSARTMKIEIESLRAECSVLLQALL